MKKSLLQEKDKNCKNWATPSSYTLEAHEWPYTLEVRASSYSYFKFDQYFYNVIITFILCN